MIDQNNFKINYSGNISWVLLGEEVFVFHEITNNIYVYKNLSKDLWLLIQHGYTINVIINLLALKYSQPYSDMQYKILRQIELLLKKDLAVLVNKNEE